MSAAVAVAMATATMAAPRAEALIEEFQSLPLIPRVVHITWPRKLDVLGTRGEPMLDEGLQSLIRANPTWRIEVSDDADMELYLRRHLTPADYSLIAGAQMGAVQLTQVVQCLLEAVPIKQ